MVLAHLVERRGTLPIGKGKLGRVDARHDVVLNEGLDALHRRLGEDEDRPGDACAAQLEALLHRGDSELVRASGMHDLHALDGAMPISIRLDDSHHAHARLELLLERTRIATQRALVDLDPGPTRVRAPMLNHGYAPPCRRQGRPSTTDIAGGAAVLLFFALRLRGNIRAAEGRTILDRIKRDTDGIDYIRRHDAP